MYSRVSKFTRLASDFGMYESDADCNGSPGFCEAGRSTASNALRPKSPSKWDLFAGYSYLAPKGTIIDNGTTAGQREID